MAGGEEGGSGCPRFLGPRWHSTGGVQDPVRSWELSPPGQDQTPTPAHAGEMPASMGMAAQHPGGRQGHSQEGDVA